MTFTCTCVNLRDLRDLNFHLRDPALLQCFPVGDVVGGIAVKVDAHLHYGLALDDEALAVFCHAHVEVEYGVSRPLRLEFSKFQTVEEGFLPGEVAVERRREQRLAEASRPAQEDVPVLAGDVVDVARLVDISALVFDNCGECLCAYGISLLHDVFS